MCESHLPDLGLIDEILPGDNVLQGREVVDVLDCVLKMAYIELNVSGLTTQKIAHGISPYYVPSIISKVAVKMSDL